VGAYLDTREEGLCTHERIMCQGFYGGRRPGLWKGMECMELGGYVVGKAPRMRALP
jgi:hypothetical protein